MQNNPYANSLETRILSATPLELVVILYDEAIDAVRAARGHLAAGNIRARSRSISRATCILIELERSLNLEAGGELSRRLAGVYYFMRSSLTEANVRQSDEGLAATEKLLLSLREAWGAIAGQSTPVPSGGEPHSSGHPELAWGALNETIAASRSWSA